MDRSRRHSHRNGRLPLVLCALCALLPACSRSGPVVDADDPELVAYLRMMMPTRIEIQHYLTKPVDFGGSSEEPDGIEALLAAYDSLGDQTKLVGTLHFELHKARPASGDPVGERVAFWPVDLTTQEASLKYWDRLARLYKFPLRFEHTPLPPGRYILTVRLISPTEDKLFDEYEFTHGIQTPAAP